MPEATEIVLLKLQDGSNPEDANLPTTATFNEAVAALKSQAGFTGHYWGLRVEDPTQFVWTIDWTDIDTHKDFINSAAYGPFVGLLAQVFDFKTAPPFFYHVNFTSQSSLSAARDAPVTEFATFNIPSNSPAATKSALEDAVLKVAQFCDANDSKGVAVGWGIEDIDVPETQQQVNALQALIGWDTVEQHMAARGQEEFGSVVSGVRALAVQSRKDMQMFHAKLRKD